MGALRLELVCHACDVVLQDEMKDELVELVSRHAESIHEHLPPWDQVLSRIRMYAR